MKAEIKTVMSCQEDGLGFVWINFDSVNDLTAFLSVLFPVFEEGNNSLYNRAVGDLMVDDYDAFWVYEISPQDIENNMDGTHTGERPWFEFSVSVRFPPSDLPEVLARMKRHNHAALEALHAALEAIPEAHRYDK